MSTLTRALAACDAASVAIMAFYRADGSPLAWPVTPYVDGDEVVITSTLAYLAKVRHLRADSRLSVLAGGHLLSGAASIRPDPRGTEFAARYLRQEIRKYPPTADYVRIPFHRRLMRWYFGRVLIRLRPVVVRVAPGEDTWTLTGRGDLEGGYPLVVPIEPPPRDDAFDVRALPVASDVGSFASGPAIVIGHREPTPADLRQARLAGTLAGSRFVVSRRAGHLDQPPPPMGLVAQIRTNRRLNRRAREAVRELADW